VHVREQIVDLFWSEHVSEAFHFASAYADDFAHPRVIGGDTTHAEIGLLECSLQARALPPARRVRRMATITILVIDAASGRLLAIQAEFSIAFSALDFASHQDHKSQGHKRPHGSSNECPRSAVHWNGSTGLKIAE
jgi:hypothetical protein